MDVGSGCSGACGAVVSTLWVFVGLMLCMFGIAWLAAGRLSRSLRPALRAMAGFNLLNGVSLLLFAQQGLVPGLMAGPFVNLLQSAGYVLLWRAGDRSRSPQGRSAASGSAPRWTCASTA